MYITTKGHTRRSVRWGNAAQLAPIPATSAAWAAEQIYKSSSNVPYSTEARDAQATGDFPRALRRLAKRRMAVRYAEPWTVAKVAMADSFIYTNGHLCYTVRGNHLRVLNTLQRSPTTELTVDVPLLLKIAIRDYDSGKPHTFQPLYFAEGILSCLDTQVLEDATTRTWLVIFELRENPRWVVVQRPDAAYAQFVRNDKHFLFLGSRSYTRYNDSQLIFWDIDGKTIGSDVCFEVIDGHFYCISITPNAPLHGDLTKDEVTGRLLIVETRKEFLDGNAGSQRTCYRKELHFGGEDGHLESVLPTPRDPTTHSLSGEWNLESYGEDRRSEDVHVGDGPTDKTVYTLQECFVRSYSPSCNSFIDLVTEAYNPSAILQLRAHPREYMPKSNLWPRGQDPSRHDRVLDLLHDIINPIQPIKSIEGCMDERILIYSPTPMAPGLLRPIILISFDPGLELLGFQNYGLSTKFADDPPRVPSQGLGSGRSRDNLESSGLDIGVPSAGRDSIPSLMLVNLRRSLYRTMTRSGGRAHGFDMSYPTT
ncbi:hypothetical protein FHETE_10350 [Fusarium heterosporum]|uniref:Uncharacterized protein n=1 Tax=Fusarium heterosporum TaxID=42747 RepID=A0A8H5SV22_FUSHE|nr:hypothetical protein FHETE_10350 [Fusarium heterosporum]